MDGTRSISKRLGTASPWCQATLSVYLPVPKDFWLHGKRWLAYIRVSQRAAINRPLECLDPTEHHGTPPVDGTLVIGGYQDTSQ